MQLGGPKLAIQTADALFGPELPVNHVVIVDFSQFEQLIDAVGGIDVNVPENILSNRFDCPYKTSAALLAVEGLALPQGRAAHGRAPRARSTRASARTGSNPADTDITRGAAPAAGDAGDADASSRARARSSGCRSAAARC